MNHINSLRGWLISYARLPSQRGLPAVKLDEAASQLQFLQLLIDELKAENEQLKLDAYEKRVVK